MKETNKFSFTKSIKRNRLNISNRRDYEDLMNSVMREPRQKRHNHHRWDNEEGDEDSENERYRQNDSIEEMREEQKEMDDNAGGEYSTNRYA